MRNIKNLLFRFRRNQSNQSTYYALCTIVIVIIIIASMFVDKKKYREYVRVQNAQDDINTYINRRQTKVDTNKQQEENNLMKANISEQDKEVESLTQIHRWIQKYRDNGTHPNVLFIIADDMRPEMGAYRDRATPWLEPNIVTPNLDGLASKSMLFHHAYCQVPLCNPSRTSFLTSRRPDTTRMHGNKVFFRDLNPNFVTLPQYFKDNGYLTLGAGKIFHYEGKIYNDNKHSWSEPLYWPHRNSCKQPNGKAWEAVTKDDRIGERKLLRDENVTMHTLDILDLLAEKKKTSDQPFFLAYGLKKPHLPFEFPEEFGRLYPLSNVSMPVNPKASPTLPDIAWMQSVELKRKAEYENEFAAWNRTHPLASWIIHDLRRAYYSCISYIDDLIGQVLQRLEDNGLADDTIVVFIGDHGFHLGEHSIVGKCTVFEVANKSPFLLRIPGITDTGLVTDELVEFVDIFPTLADLASLPEVPQCPAGEESRQVDLCTEGSSLLPLLDDGQYSWKKSVFFQYPHTMVPYGGHPGQYIPLSAIIDNHSGAMGYTIRTKKYRYTEWVHYMPGSESTNWTHLYGTELYDHITDPLEMTNLADSVELDTVRNDLSIKLRLGWSDALPTE